MVAPLSATSSAMCSPPQVPVGRASSFIVAFLFCVALALLLAFAFALDLLQEEPCQDSNARQRHNTAPSEWFVIIQIRPFERGYIIADGLREGISTGIQPERLDSIPTERCKRELLRFLNSTSDLSKVWKRRLNSGSRRM